MKSDFRVSLNRLDFLTYGTVLIAVLDAVFSKCLLSNPTFESFTDFSKMMSIQTDSEIKLLPGEARLD